MPQGEWNMDSAYKVSVIIPVYNVEKYLCRCLDSVLNQTYQNIQVIVVDDGSGDRSPQLCDEYARKDSRVRVIHQQNQGQAAARNHAVKLAEGAYIAYVDSDDYVTADYIEYLVKLQKKYNTDVVFARGLYVYDGKPLPAYKDEDSDCVLSAEETLIRLNYNMGMGAMIWGKLFRRELIEAYPFPEGQIYEDLATLYKIVGACREIAYGQHRVYFWTQRGGSTMRSAFNKRQLAAFQATRDQLQYMQRAYPTVVPSVKARHMTKVVEIMPLALKSTGSREAYETLKKEMIFYDEVIRDKKIRKLQKIRLRAIRMGYLPAKIVVLAHEKLKKTIL